MEVVAVAVKVVQAHRCLAPAVASFKQGHLIGLAVALEDLEGGIKRHVVLAANGEISRDKVTHLGSQAVSSSSVKGARSPTSQKYPPGNRDEWST